MDLLRGVAAEFPDDAQLCELEKRAQDGIRHKAEAGRLITESQELFAQQKSAEAIQLLRKAHELDKQDPLARSILANALVERAHALVESDWLEAEKLTNQALALNPSHPTAKTILGLIVIKKETSPVRNWVSQARKLQSAGDLFAALAWVAEGLAVHPHEPQLLQIQNEIQRDQEAQRRQARRGDLDELRRLQREIDGAADIAAKQALAARIQAVAAKHWTDGEILSIANALLLRLGLVQQESTGAAPRSKGATVILHVPRPSAPKPARADSPSVESGPVESRKLPPAPIEPGPILANTALPSPALPSPVNPTPVQSGAVEPGAVRQSSPPPEPVLPKAAPAAIVSATVAAPSKVPLRSAPRGRVRISPPEPQLPASQAVAVPKIEPSAAPATETSTPRVPRQPARPKSTTLVLVSAAVMILVAATFFLTRRYYAPRAGQVPVSAPGVSTPAATAATAPAAAAPTSPAAAPVQPTPEPSQAALPAASESGPSDTATGNVPNEQPFSESMPNAGTLLVVAGQDGARVFLNGKLQPRLTQSGLLRLPNLAPRDYVVQVSKSGFQDPSPQRIRIRNGEQAKLVFNFLPQPRLASLTIQGGNPGTTVFVDQTLVGTIQPDGTLAVSTVNPGNHTVELRKERFKPRQFRKHFNAGETISLAATDATLEAVPAELKITFAPADAMVAISKGELLTVVKSGVPLHVAPGTYTLTARTTDRSTRSSTLEVTAGDSKSLNLSLAPNGMSKWDDPSAWKREGDSFTRKGGDFVLYGVVPASGTFAFSVMLTRGHLLQWVLNYTDAKNYVLCQLDDNNFYRTVIRNGEKTNEIKIPKKSDRKSFREFHLRVSPTELVSQVREGNSWTVLDRWTQPNANLSLGKFGFYLPGNDQLALSSFAHYADLNLH